MFIFNADLWWLNMTLQEELDLTAMKEINHKVEGDDSKKEIFTMELSELLFAHGQK